MLAEGLLYQQLFQSAERDNVPACAGGAPKEGVECTPSDSCCLDNPGSVWLCTCVPVSSAISCPLEPCAQVRNRQQKSSSAVCSYWRSTLPLFSLSQLKSASRLHPEPFLAEGGIEIK